MTGAGDFVETAMRHRIGDDIRRPAGTEDIAFRSDDIEGDRDLCQQRMNRFGPGFRSLLGRR